MSLKNIVIFVCAAVGLCVGATQAAKVEFAQRELFHVPFGDSGNMLGARIEGSNVVTQHE